MPDAVQIRRYECMLFNYGTVYKTDYRDGEIKPNIPTVYKEKPTLDRRPEFRPVKDTHTLTQRRVQVPFDLFIKPKEIIRTNPREVQETFTKFEDLDRKEVQRTRPRLVMPPAVSMDNIEDDEVRDMLIRDVYLSTVRKATEEGVALTKYRTVRAPFPDHPAPANPITLPALTPHYVSPEWRMESVSWDRRQLRAHCDPTKEFWLARTPKCTVCDATAERQAQKKMQEQMKHRS